MMREHWKSILPIIEAFVDGEKVEWYSDARGWIPLRSPGFDLPRDLYRIAPKSRKVWVNEYPHDGFSAWPSREAADFYPGTDRIACHEIELPPLP